MATNEKMEDLSQTLSQEIKDHMECPICLEIPKSTKIYQCENGHTVCEQCFSKSTVKICPLCRESMFKTRSLITEQVLARVLLKKETEITKKVIKQYLCRNSRHGCTKKLPTQIEIEHHESEECVYRRIHCVELNCQIKVSFIHLFDHIHENHKNLIRLNQDQYSGWVDSNNGKNPPVHFEFNGYHFFHEIWRSEENGSWFTWVYYWGGSSKSDNSFYYTVKIFCMDEELTYTGKVIPLDLGFEEITTSGIGLVFSEATAFHFMKNNKIHYSVQIRPKRNKKTSNFVEPSAPPAYLVNDEIITDNNDSAEFQNVNSNNEEYTISNGEQSEDHTTASSAAGLITTRKWNV